MRGRYPSEVGIIAKPRQSKFRAGGESDRERHVLGGIQKRGGGKEKNCSSHIDCNLGYYRISIR